MYDIYKICFVHDTENGSFNFEGTNLKIDKLQIVSAFFHWKPIDGTKLLLKMYIWLFLKKMEAQHQSHKLQNLVRSCIDF